MKVNKEQINSVKCDIVRLLSQVSQIKSCHVIAATLELIESEIASFDPPPPKNIPYRTKHDVDRMTLCGDMTIRKFDIS